MTALLRRLTDELTARRLEVAQLEQRVTDLESRTTAVEFQAGPQAEAPPGRSTASLDDPSLLGVKAGLMDPDPAARATAINTARVKQHGPILHGFIADERRALLALADQLRGVHAVFSLERGGSFVADAIMRLVARLPGREGEAIQNVKVPKPTPGDVRSHVEEFSGVPARQREVASLTEQSTKFQGSREQLEEWAARQRQVHAEKFKKAVISLVTGSARDEIVIAITETAVSGASVNTVVELAGQLVQDLKRLVPAKRVSFKVLALREMIKKDPKAKAEGEIRLQDPVRLLEKRGAGGTKKMGGVAEFPPRELRSTDLEQVSLHLSQTQYLIGEDVDYQLAYEGHESGQPVIVFDAQGQSVVALQITPAGGGDRARHVLLDVIAGVYDGILQEMVDSLPGQAEKK